MNLWWHCQRTQNENMYKVNDAEAYRIATGYEWLFEGEQQRQTDAARIM